MRRLFLTLSLVIAMLSAAKPLTVVIDAGHGGHDSGAPGSTINEKTVNLRVALKLGKELKKQLKDDVKIIYTRDNDFFVTLAGRAEIANKNEADLFVSIHSNSIGNEKRRHLVSGSSVYVRGFASSKKAQEVAQRENSVLELEDKTKIDTSSEESVLTDLVWDKNLEESIILASSILDELVSTAGRKRGAVEQNDLAVLKRTKMPAVLVELEYICNPTMEKFMASDNGQNKFAEAICNGIITYCSNTTKKLHTTTPSTTKKRKSATATKPETKQDNRQQTTKDNQSASDKPVYKIQILTSSQPIAATSKKFKGLTGIDSYTDGKIVKYTVGAFATQKEASAELPEIKRLFPDAFVIKFQNGKRVK